MFLFLIVKFSIDKSISKILIGLLNCKGIIEFEKTKFKSYQRRFISLLSLKIHNVEKLNPGK